MSKRWSVLDHVQVYFDWAIRITKIVSQVEWMSRRNIKLKYSRWEPKDHFIFRDKTIINAKKPLVDVWFSCWFVIHSFFLFIPPKIDHLNSMMRQKQKKSDLDYYFHFVGLLSYYQWQSFGRVFSPSNEINIQIEINFFFRSQWASPKLVITLRSIFFACKSSKNDLDFFFSSAPPPLHSIQLRSFDK